MTRASFVSSKGPRVFINFRGKDLRKTFICFLVTALRKGNINVYIDEDEERGKKLTTLFERIRESEIVLVIFSEGYTESKWCLDELVEITERVEQEKLRVIPIFYKLDIAVVKHFQGKFGDQLKDLVSRCDNTKPESSSQKWKEAVVTICQRFALNLPEDSDKTDEEFISIIVEDVRKMLLDTSAGRNGKTLQNDKASNEEAVAEQVKVDKSKNMTKILPVQPYESKIWVLEARELSITWSHNPIYWLWIPLRLFPSQNQKTPREPGNKEVAYLRNVCWLNITGKFDTQCLSPRTRYEVVFVVVWIGSKWKGPVNVQLVVPKSMGKLQERSVNIYDIETIKWMDIPVGEFTTLNKNMGEISFAMWNYDCDLWKSGLFIKCVEIRPK
ncbi:hypothetical protein CARUB_v10026583mg [Capsella rubella]|uniref:TIR domain-containing protein n=1 Tax=Capsella rubella TaxID=81985 RepID=R0EWF9_9BRAS|nr:protein PHLOEM PROTEIN 2-LIKE A5 [Capsella rubella]EOA13517.1 hypothetical protein CARUB_v10026583mg [Capsella rubella]